MENELQENLSPSIEEIIKARKISFQDIKDHLIKENQS